MIGMPEALTIMSFCAIIIAAIIKRDTAPKQGEQLHSINAATCAACKAEITRRIEERSEESKSIFRELKKHGEQLARIETRLEAREGAV